MYSMMQWDSKIFLQNDENKAICTFYHYGQSAAVSTAAWYAQGTKKNQ